jgi:hypothetical protein
VRNSENASAIRHGEPRGGDVDLFDFAFKANFNSLKEQR